MPGTHIVELSSQGKAPQSLLDRLGDSLYSAEEQAANPDAPMTRIVKDVLRPGTWGKGEFQAKAGTLREIARQYELATRNGEKSALYWGAPIAEGQHNIKAKDRIAPIERFIVHDDQLYMVSYVTPAVAAELAGKEHRVSIKLVDPYEDGAGRRYNMFAEHVAVVDHAAVTGQQNFIALANEDPEDSDESSEMLIVSDLTEVINQMLGLMGISAIEADVPQEQLVAILRTKLQTLRDLTGGSEPSQPEESMSDSKTAAETQQLENDVKELKARIVELENRNAELEQEKADAAKTAWATELDNLFAANRIDAATKALLEKCGESLSYELDNLAQYRDASLTTSERKTVSLANGDEPAVRKAGPTSVLGMKAPAARSDEEVAAALKAKGIN